MSCPSLIPSAYQKRWFWPQGTLSWVSASRGATFALLLLLPRWCPIRRQQLQQLRLTTGSGHGEEWRGGSPSRCLPMPFLRKTAPPAPPHSTVYRFELVIRSLVCLLGLHRVGRCRSVTWVCTGCSSSQLAPPGASTRWVFVSGEHRLLCICSQEIKR